jgi:protocatechuate 3,4-dioxygenase beta subunit
LCSIANCQENAGAGQPAGKPVGGYCEGCEAIYECPVSFHDLNNVDSLPDFNLRGPKLELSGFIYHSDGHTPAANVILYIYHTNWEGIYPTRGNEQGWAKRHGYIRGWIKTGPDGFYKFYTRLPGSYPHSKNPKHIHPVIKEPGLNEYWIDEFLFAGDPFLKGQKLSSSPRGGNGIVKAVMKDGTLKATRHIVLGLNVPGYPSSK